MLKQSIVALALGSSALMAGPALADHLNIATDGMSYSPIVGQLLA